MYRTTIAIAFLVSFHVPLLGQDAKPTKVFLKVQTATIERLFSDAVSTVQKIGGKEKVDEFHESIEQRLGKKGLSGLDLKKPLLAYMNSNHNEDNRLPLYVIVPISNQNDFIDLLRRAEFTVSNYNNTNSIFKLEVPEYINQIEESPFLILQNQSAYFVFNSDIDSIKTSQLLKPNDLLLPNSSDTITFQMNLQETPKLLKEPQEIQKELYETILDSIPIPENFKSAISKLLERSDEFNQLIYKDGNTYSVKINFDTNKLALNISYRLTSIENSELEKLLLSKDSVVNRFANFATENHALSIITRLPFFDRSIKELANLGLDLLEDSMTTEIPQPFQKLAKAAFNGVKETVNSGRVELGLSIVGDKLHRGNTVNFGMRMQDTTEINIEFRKIASELPIPPNVLFIDDHKVDETAVHRIEIKDFIPEPFNRIFDKDSSLYFAIAKDAILISFGNHAKQQISSNIRAKDEPAPALLVSFNGIQLASVLEQLPDVPEELLEFMKSKDFGITFVKLSVQYGKALEINFTLDLNFITIGKE